jgi:hypothetical protein
LDDRYLRPGRLHSFQTRWPYWLPLIWAVPLSFFCFPISTTNGENEIGVCPFSSALFGLLSFSGLCRSRHGFRHGRMATLGHSYSLAYPSRSPKSSINALKNALENRAFALMYRRDEPASCEKDKIAKFAIFDRRHPRSRAPPLLCLRAGNESNIRRPKARQHPL